MVISTVSYLLHCILVRVIIIPYYCCVSSVLFSSLLLHNLGPLLLYAYLGVVVIFQDILWPSHRSRYLHPQTGGLMGQHGAAVKYVRSCNIKGVTKFLSSLYHMGPCVILHWTWLVEMPWVSPRHQGRGTLPQTELTPTPPHSHAHSHISSDYISAFPHLAT